MDQQMRKTAGKTRLSMRKIAELAGVSPTTVSFVLNNRAGEFGISEATCERVRAVVQEYNYRQNFHGRAIKAGRTFLVGVIIHNLTSSFWNHIIAGISHELIAHGYHMLLDESGNDPARERQAFEYMAQIGVDGIISALNFAYEDSEKIVLPHYWYDQLVVNVLHPLPGIPSVYTDHGYGVGRIVEEFWQHGHRNIAFLGDCSGDINLRYNENFRVFCELLRQKDVEAMQFDTAEELLSSPRRVTAVLCRRDHEAFLLYEAAKKRNIRIPEDISIAGYGCSQEFLNRIPFPLTTVRECKQELGEMAAKRLLELINGNVDSSAPLYTAMQPQFVAGVSIGRIN